MILVHPINNPFFFSFIIKNDCPIDLSNSSHYDIIKDNSIFH